MYFTIHMIEGVQGKSAYRIIFWTQHCNWVFKFGKQKNLQISTCVYLCSVRSTIERYKKATSDTPNAGSVSEANAQVNTRPDGTKS